MGTAIRIFRKYIEHHRKHGKGDMMSHYEKALDDIQSAAHGDPKILLKPIFLLLKEDDKGVGP